MFGNKKIYPRTKPDWKAGIDLLPDFRTSDKLRNWLPIRISAQSAIYGRADGGDHPRGGW
jgi:hypothetical protein